MKRVVRRALISGVTAAALSGVIGVGVYLTWLRTPPPMPQTLDEAAAVFASPRYRRLPDTRRAAYVIHVRQLVDALPAAERSRVWEQWGSEPGLRDATRRARQDMMVVQARQFAAADAKTRTAMVDAFLAMRRGGGPPTDPEEREQRRADARQRMMQYTQYGDPQNQAYVQEFWKAVRQRRQELGIQ
jgi:hypothetical protein